MAKAKVAETEVEDEKAPGADGDYDAPPTTMEFEDDVADAERPPILPKGKYPVSCTDAKARRSKTTEGNQYVETTWHIDPSSYPVDYEGSEDGESLKYRRTTWGKTDPRSRYNLKKWLDAIGAPMGKAVDLNDWLGCEAIAVVDHERSETDGELWPVITRIVKK